MPTRRAPRALLAAAATTTIVVTAACSADGGTTRQDGRPAPVPTATARAASAGLPIEDYMLTADQSVRYQYVTDAVIRDCMRRHGLDYPEAATSLPAPDSFAVQSRTVMFRRYGVTDEATARQWGYHVPHDTGPATPSGPPPTLTPGERRTLLGTEGGGPSATARDRVPSGGCVGEATREVNGDTPAELQPGHGDLGIVPEIKSRSFRASLADRRVLAAFSSWSSCMGRRGYHVSAPLEAADGLPSLKDSRPSAGEIAQAGADVACKNETGLVTTWHAVEAEYQSASIKEHAGELDRARRARDTQTRNIQRLLEKFPPSG
ncbi:hypothetical protein [Streptomyces sp. NPDC002537]